MSLRKTDIEFATWRWDPVIGCTKWSDGCLHCWAKKTIEERFPRNPTVKNPALLRPFHEIRVNEWEWDAPLGTKVTGRVFVGSYSDLGHEQVASTVRQHVVDVARQCPHLDFLVLSKRPETLAAEWEHADLPSNLWVGATVEGEEYAHRIDTLRRIPAKVRWLCMEPLVKEVTGVDLSGIQWVVVGGEHDPEARGMKAEWVEWVDAVYDAARRAGTAFWFKQWPRTGRKHRDDYRGRQFKEYPAADGSIVVDTSKIRAVCETAATAGEGVPPGGGEAKVGRAPTVRGNATGAAKLVARALKSGDATVRGMAEALDFEVAELASGRSDLEPLVEEMTANLKYVLRGTCREGWNDKVQALLDRRYATWSQRR